MTIDLKPKELETLRWLKWKGGVCNFAVDDEVVLGVWGEIEVPSRRMLGRLVKKGLVMLTEEDGDWSPMYDLTELGEEVLKQNIDK